VNINLIYNLFIISNLTLENLKIQRLIRLFLLHQVGRSFLQIKFKLQNYKHKMQHVANLINSGYKKIMEKKVLTNYTSFNK